MLKCQDRNKKGGNNMKYLVVVAHPDDEVLGAGATIHKLISQGNEVAIATMANHAAARSNISDTLANDEAEALKIMSVTKLFAADFPNIKMNTIAHLDLVKFIESCIEDFGAEAIITHHPSDTNNDHVQTSYAVQAASRLFQRKPNIPTLKKLLYMEIPSSTEWSFDCSSIRFTPNYFVEIGTNGLEVKLEALKAYKGIMRPYPHPRSDESIRGLAAFRGAQSGCNYAEAFECVFERQ